MHAYSKVGSLVHVGRVNLPGWVSLLRAITSLVRRVTACVATAIHDDRVERLIICERRELVSRRLVLLVGSRDEQGGTYLVLRGEINHRGEW